MWGLTSIIIALLGHVGMISMPPWTILSFWKHYSAPYAKASSFLVNYNSICIAWKIVLRKMWCVSPMTHCNIITVLTDSKPLELGLMQNLSYLLGQLFTERAISYAIHW